MIKMVMHNRVKYVTKSCGERAREWRDREGERDRVLLQMSDGMGNKFDY
jgi:hypothetical protein